jgi:hypothetical protein
VAIALEAGAGAGAGAVCAIAADELKTESSRAVFNALAFAKLRSGFFIFKIPLMDWCITNWHKTRNSLEVDNKLFRLDDIQ